MGLLEAKIKEVQDAAAFEGKKAVIQIMDAKDIVPGTWSMFWDDDTRSFGDIAIGKYGSYDEGSDYPHVIQEGSGYHHAQAIPEDILERFKNVLPAGMF
jgi:hypothetical protein